MSEVKWKREKGKRSKWEGGGEGGEREARCDGVGGGEQVLPRRQRVQRVRGREVEGGSVSGETKSTRPKWSRQAIGQRKLIQRLRRP